MRYIKNDRGQENTARKKRTDVSHSKNQKNLNLRGNGRDNVASDSLGAVERLKRLNAKDK